MMELFQSTDNVTFNGSSCTLEVTGPRIFKRYVYSGIPDTFYINFTCWVRHSRWYLGIFWIKEDEIKKKCGPDAVYYIRFQKYLLLYMAIVTVLSTAVILPVNLTGNNIVNITEFSHTTIANLDVESKLLWVHIVLSSVYVILAMIFMLHFSYKCLPHDEKQKSKTLMIVGIPREKCQKTVIQQMFKNLMVPVLDSSTKVDVNFAYDVKDLMKLDKKRMFAKLALIETRDDHTVRPCYFCYCLRCCYQEEKAFVYYNKEIDDLTQEFEEQEAKALDKCLGVAFVTFKDVDEAEEVLTSYNTGWHAPFLTGRMRISYAPAHKDIYWEKLSLHGWRWWCRAIFINGALFISLFFFTTPSIIVSSLNNLRLQDFVEKTNNAYIVKFVPILLLWISAALLPFFVFYTDKYIGHWTRSSEHHAVMLKTLTFLLLMVLILPSLSLTSVKAVFVTFVLGKDETVEWKCLFVTGNGAFFVNYVITATFIGSAMELLRPTELLAFVVKLLRSKSLSERTSIRQHVLQEFQYGMQYARLLCVFTVIISFSVSCPLITPFGLLYMLLKNTVDRHNLYFAYKSSHTTPQIHRTAITYVVLSVLFLQLNLLFFVAIREGEGSRVWVVSCLFLVICFLNWRSVKKMYRVMSSQRTPIINDSENDDDLNQPFVASVLSRSQNNPMSDTPSPSATLAQSYGTINTR